MKRNLIVTSLGALSLLLSTGAYAQSSTKATVPFSFIAAGVEMPAGDYQINQDAPSHVTTIADRRSGKLVYAFPSTTIALPITANPKLVFKCYGNQHFLEAVWTGGGGTAMMFPATSVEKQARAHMVATNPAGSTSETVAMK